SCQDRRDHHGGREARAEELLLHRRPQDPRGLERRDGEEGAGRLGGHRGEGDRLSGTEPGAKTTGGFHPNVIALGFTSFFTDISSEMLVPVMPLFVTVTLGASLASLGLIEGVAEATASALRLVSGRV